MEGTEEVSVGDTETFFPKEEGRQRKQRTDLAFTEAVTPTTTSSCDVLEAKPLESL